jgi:hypothetical protein
VGICKRADCKIEFETTSPAMTVNSACAWAVPVKLAAGVPDPPPHAVNKTTKAQKIHCNLFNIIFPIELNLFSDYQAS